MNSLPIIRLELEGMKLAMQTALMARNVEMDQYVQQALDRYCSQENLQSVIDTEVRAVLNTAIKEEIQSFFRYSIPGRQAIREAVHAHLDEFWAPIRGAQG